MCAFVFLPVCVREKFANREGWETFADPCFPQEKERDGERKRERGKASGATG